MKLSPAGGGLSLEALFGPGDEDVATPASSPLSSPPSSPSSSSPSSSPGRPTDKHSQLRSEGPQQPNGVVVESEVRADVEDTADSKCSDASSSQQLPLPQRNLLTKAKLFTQSDEDGDWVEIGVGTARVVVAAADADKPTDANDAPRRPPSAMLEMAELDTADMLMRTPVSADDIYLVQRGSILIWQDPEIEKSVAVSFSTVDGCNHVVEAINAFQRAYRQALRDEASASPIAHGGAAIGRTSSGNGVRSHTGLSATESSLDEARDSPWSVRRENLPALVLAAQDNRHRFSHYIQSTPTFFKDVASVFRACCVVGDLVGKNHVAKLTMALLSQPFNTEQKVLMQLVEKATINATIEIVQFAIHGDQNADKIETEQQRLAKFCNPGDLHDDIVGVVHYIFALQSLRDLVPLHLDDGEPGGSMLGLYLLRMKLSIYHDICVDATFLPQLFKKHLSILAERDSAAADHAGLDDVERHLLNHFTVTASFLLELTANVKNAMIPEEGKTNILTELARRGVCDFLQAVLGFALNHVAVGAESAAQVTSTIAKAVDVLSHCVVFAPNAVRLELMRQVERFHESLVERPGERGSSRSLLLLSVDRTLAPRGSGAHDEGTEGDDGPRQQPQQIPSLSTQREATAEADAGRDSATPLRPQLSEGSKDNRRDGTIVVDGDSHCAAVTATVPQPLLRLVIAAQTVVEDPIATQCICDCIAALGVGLLQKSAGPQLTGPATLPLRQRVLRYWTEGTSRPLTAAAFMARVSGGLSGSPVDGAGGEVGGALDEEPPLALLLRCVSNFVERRMGAAVGSSAGARHSGRLSSALSTELVAFHATKSLVLLFRQKHVTSCAGFLRLLQRHRFVANLAAIVSGRAPASTKLRCNALSLAADLVGINDEVLLRSLVDDGLIGACAGVLCDNRRRNNILTSAARNVFTTVHTSVTEKRALLTQAGSPLLSMSFARSPFSSSLASTNGDGSNAQNPETSAAGATVTTYLVAHVLDQHGAALLECGATDTLDYMRRALHPDDPPRTGDASSAVPSTSSQVSTDEYVRMLAEFGGVASSDELDGGQFLLRRQSFSRHIAAEGALPAAAPEAEGVDASGSVAAVVAQLVEEAAADDTAWRGDSDLPSKRKRIQSTCAAADSGGGIFDE